MNALIPTLIPLFLAPLLGCESVSEHDDYHYTYDDESEHDHDRGGGAHAEPVSLLEISQWRVVKLQGQPLESELGAQSPMLRFDGLEQRVTGYTGVNQINGTYMLDGSTLRFGPMAMTRMAGPEPQMQQESAMTQVLARTAMWRTTGDGIELLDAEGNPLARLER